LDSAAFQQALEALFQSIASLEVWFDEKEVSARPPVALDEREVQTFETALQKFDGVLRTQRTLSTYIFSFVSTDSGDALAQGTLSQLEQHASKLGLLRTRLTAWIGALDVEALIARSSVAREHAFAVRKAKRQASHLMSPPEEALAAELDLSGGTAWSKLHGTFCSQLSVELVREGQVQTLPMSGVRNLANDPERAVRQAAYEAELSAWQSAEVPLAAALNSIKAQVNTLAQRRGWASPLEQTLFASNMDAPTLDALMEAACEAFVDFRRYLKVKAKALGLEVLAWYDLFAPLGQQRTWDFDQAETFIVEQFGTFSSELQALARRAFNERWIDAQPRNNKRGGAFCMSLRGEESRILSNYTPSYGGVSTLAHELGHAYHNLNLAKRTEFQRATPMTLAETASTFCETIVRKAALKDAPTGEKIAILEASLQGACQVVVDIISRFRFERAVFEQRVQRELSAEEFKALMLDAQRQTYGSGLDPERLHPYMWAVKPHYYSADRSYYNFPYLFGLLFALGLYARYEDDPKAFRASYDALLSSTGLADAAELTRRFGIEITTPAFWRGSLDVLREDIDTFERLIEAKQQNSGSP